MWTCVLKTRVATRQHWEFGLFRVGYWQQGCGRCEAPFYREASPKKKGQDTPFSRGAPVFTAMPQISSKPAFLHWTYCKILQTHAKLQSSFQIKEIHCEHGCWRLGSLPGSAGNLGFSGWDIDNRVVDVVRHHSIERLPQKKRVRTLHFIEGYPFSQPRQKFHPNQPFYTGQIAKYCKNRRNCNFHFK